MAVYFWDENRDDAEAKRERDVLTDTSADAASAAESSKKTLEALAAALAAGPANQEAAINLLLKKMEELQDRQTQVIIREQRSSPETVVVYITPEPQPTATVTCNPTPVVGNCRGPRR